MRKLATLRRIAEVRLIEGADLIGAYRVDGWWVVDKKGQYQVGDLVVYCEVDSWIPHELAPFLSKGKEPRVFEGIPGERLRTVKLKGQVSQGLFLPVKGGRPAGAAFYVTRPDGLYAYVSEGDDVTELLGIQKWEAPVPAQLAGQIRGNFPSGIPKTDQERVQNLRFESYTGELYEVTEKLHGSSCTFYLDNEGVFHVCSRNLDLKPSESNAYWKAAYKYNVEAEMNRLGLNGCAIQGELCGEGINGNQYKLGLEFFAFDVFTVSDGYLAPVVRQDIIRQLGLQHVPIVQRSHLLTNSAAEILNHADGCSVLADCRREGLVFKSHSSDKTFKAVSNAWLLKHE